MNRLGSLDKLENDYDCRCDDDRAFVHRSQLEEQVYFSACSTAAKAWRYAIQSI